MLDRLKEMVYTFACVETGVLFACASFLTVFNKDGSFSVSLLWQIMITTLACVFGNLIYPNRKISRKRKIIYISLHYLYVVAVVFACAYLFYWFDIRNIKMSAFLLFCITVIFLVVSWFLWNRTKRMSERLNDQLKEYQSRKEEDLKF